MTKYLLIYQGQLDGPMPEPSQEQNDAMMQAWGTGWIGSARPLPTVERRPVIVCESAARRAPSDHRLQHRRRGQHRCG